MATYSGAISRTVAAAAVAIPNGAFNFTITAGAGTTRLTIPGFTCSAGGFGLFTSANLLLETMDPSTGLYSTELTTIAQLNGSPFTGVSAGSFTPLLLTALGVVAPNIAPRQGGTYGDILLANAYLPDLILLPSQRVRIQGNYSATAGTCQMVYYTSVEI